MNSGFEKAEEEAFSHAIYAHTNLSTEDSEDIAKVCVGSGNYLLDAGLKWNPEGLVMHLLSDHIKDQLENQILDDPTVKSAEKYVTNSSHWGGYWVNQWINDSLPWLQKAKQALSQ